MNIESKKFLYNQLKEISRISFDKENVMPEEEFYSLTDKKLIEYVFKYRDRQRVYMNGKLARAYIELPDCDLEGWNMEGIELSRFVPGIIENGEIRKSKINLRNTGAIVNLSTVFHNEERITENGYEYITDLTGCDFHGCKIYGRTQEEMKQYSEDSRVRYIFKGKDVLDEQYVKRRRLHTLSPEQKKVSDYIYGRLIDKLSLSFSLRKEEEVDLTDYDFSGLSEKEIAIIMRNLQGFKINMSFTGINTNKFGKETRFSQIKSLHDAVKMGNSEFVQDFIDTYPDRSFVARFVESEYKKGRQTYGALKKYNVSEEVLKKYADYEYEKNPETFSTENYRYLTTPVFKKIMLEALEQGDYSKILSNSKNMPRQLAAEIVSKALKLDAEDFLKEFMNLPSLRYFTSCFIEIYNKKGLDFIPEILRNNELYEYALLKESRKGNMDFVYQNIMHVSRATISRVIVEDCRRGNIEFAKKYFEYTPDELKEAIIIKAYEEKDIEFVGRNLDKIKGKKDRAQIMINVSKNNSEDFYAIVEMLPQNIINELALEFSEERKTTELKICWSMLPLTLQKQIAKQQKDVGNEAFFRDMAFQGETNELLIDELVTQKQLEEYIKKGSKNGNLLVRFISLYPDKIDVIKRLIQAGDNVNGKRKFEYGKTPIPILQLVLETEAKQVRGELLYELLKANVDTNVNVRMREDKKENGSYKTEIYQGSIGNSPTYKKLVSNVGFMRKFLRQEVNLDEQIIKKLENFLKENHRQPINMKLYEFSFRKIIFDYYKVTKMAFVHKHEIFLKPVELLYAQARFFRDIGKKIHSQNFWNTLGLSNKEFAEKYGHIIAKGYNGEPEKIEEVVTQMLIGMYPMPSNIMKFKKCVEGDREMILVNEDRKNGDLLRVYESGNVLEFTDGKVLPIEQRELLLEMLKSGYKAKLQDIDSEIERAERENAANEILKKLQDPRLKEKAKIYTAYSDGGAQTAKDGSDKTQIENKNAKVKYLVIDINGSTILEPFGQKNNATFLALNDEELETKVSKFGRKAALENGFFKIIHEGNNIDAYNYSSNHLVRILDMVIENKDRMFRILESVRNGGRKFCNLLTLESKFGAVRLAEEYNLSKEEILSVGLEEKMKEGDEIDEK